MYRIQPGKIYIVLPLDTYEATLEKDYPETFKFEETMRIKNKQCAVFIDEHGRKWAQQIDLCEIEDPNKQRSSEIQLE